MKLPLIPPHGPQPLPDQLVAIPGGEIVLRDDRIKHQWHVVIKPFFLASYPVTQEQYFGVTAQSPSTFQGANHPVENVSWRDAVLFCNALSDQAGLTACYLIPNENEEIAFDATANGFRLPSEAEWEYACKAGNLDARYGELSEIAWYKANADQTTHAVGMKQPNAWGLYDMLGNVWEWCSDMYDEQVYGSYRIFRGGGWCDAPRSCLATNRRRSHPSFRIDDLGFRIARNAP